MTTTQTAVDVSVLELRTPAETEKGAELLHQVWRGGAMPVVANLLRAVQQNGGYVFGAYDASGELVAATMAFRSHEGLHSHITGVLPSGHRRGVGLALKRHQRLWALERGIDTITWTCDPLIRRNVAFNLHALGAQVVEYLPDHYGSMNDGVNAGEETDRFEFRWDLRSPEAVAATAGRLPWIVPTGDVRLVPLPADIERDRSVEPRAAWAWRQSVRQSMLPALASGARVQGMTAAGVLVLQP